MNFYRSSDIDRSVRPYLRVTDISPGTADLRIPSDGIDLEIGAGCGEHAIAFAKENPGRRLVAIERTRNRFGKFQKAYSEADKPSNLVPVRADAVRWISENLPAGVVGRCFILYPNPYPKRKQMNLRWAQMPFMGELLSKLRVGGQLEMRSNILDYIEESKGYFTRHWGLELIEESFVKENPQTLFEKKYLERGEHCQRVVFRKSNLN